MQIIGSTTTYHGTEHRYLVGYEVRVIAVIKGAAGPDYDPDADGAYLTDDEDIARAGGVTADDGGGYRELRPELAAGGLVGPAPQARPAPYLRRGMPAGRDPLADLAGWRLVQAPQGQGKRYRCRDVQTLPQRLAGHHRQHGSTASAQVAPESKHDLLAAAFTIVRTPELALSEPVSPQRQARSRRSARRPAARATRRPDALD